MEPKRILGGAAIASSYGKFISSSPITADEAKGIFSTAAECGFDAIDVAPAYGDAENLVGELGWHGEVHTKLALDHDVLDSVTTSLRFLRRRQVDVLYLGHSAEQVLNHPLGLETLIGLCQPYASSIGVSVYSSEELDFFSGVPGISVIQLPIHLLSEATVNATARLGAHRPSIYARSVFLQGLLLANPSDVPGRLRQSITNFVDLSDQLGIPRIQLALGWVLGQKNIDGVVLGARTTSEIRQLAEAFTASKLSSEILDALSRIERPGEDLIDPRNWN